MLNKLFKKTTVQYDSGLDHFQELSDMEASSVVGGYKFNANGTIDFDENLLNLPPAGAGVDVDTFIPVEQASAGTNGKISESQTTPFGLFNKQGAELSLTTD